VLYLASPYSHPDLAVREQRYRAACAATAALLRSGVIVFAPIVHSHPLVEYGLPTGWEFWERCDREHLQRCDEVAVLMLDGWRDCAGVQAEVRLATELGKPIRYLDPEDLLGSLPTEDRP
jgi:nucleoside 2-deoxyribosyltransferase